MLDHLDGDLGGHGSALLLGRRWYGMSGRLTSEAQRLARGQGAKNALGYIAHRIAALGPSIVH